MSRRLGKAVVNGLAGLVIRVVLGVVGIAATNDPRTGTSDAFAVLGAIAVPPILAGVGAWYWWHGRSILDLWKD
jgi:hypothetical protein